MYWRHTDLRVRTLLTPDIGAGSHGDTGPVSTPPGTMRKEVKLLDMITEIVYNQFVISNGLFLEAL